MGNVLHYHKSSSFLLGDLLMFYAFWMGAFSKGRPIWGGDLFEERLVKDLNFYHGDLSEGAFSRAWKIRGFTEIFRFSKEE